MPVCWLRDGPCQEAFVVSCCLPQNSSRSVGLQVRSHSQLVNLTLGVVSRMRCRHRSMTDLVAGKLCTPAHAARLASRHRRLRAGRRSTLLGGRRGTLSLEVRAHRTSQSPLASPAGGSLIQPHSPAPTLRDKTSIRGGPRVAERVVFGHVLRTPPCRFSWVFCPCLCAWTDGARQRRLLHMSPSALRPRWGMPRAHLARRRSTDACKYGHRPITCCMIGLRCALLLSHPGDVSRFPQVHGLAFRSSLAWLSQHPLDNTIGCERANYVSHLWAGI